MIIFTRGLWSDITNEVNKLACIAVETPIFTDKNVEKSHRKTEVFPSKIKYRTSVSTMKSSENVRSLPNAMKTSSSSKNPRSDVTWEMEINAKRIKMMQC